jgi:Protein of unknown function DUF262
VKPSIRTLGEILYSPSQYIIPVFQRNYRWEQPQWAQLWDSLIEIQAPDKHGNHFMGFLVFVPGVAQPGQHTSFHLIDGQQRLATSSLILAALRNFARENGQQDLADEIHQYYLTHPLKKGEQHYRLLPKERDHDSYISIVTGKGEPTGRMADALAYFEERLAELSEGSVLTRELANYDRWTDQEIRVRGRQLAKEAVLIWIGPKEQFVRADPDADDADEGPGRQELRRRFWRGLNDYLVAEHPDLPDFDARPSWTIRLPSGIRHIGFELRFSLRHNHAGIDVWFWRDASIPVWAAIRKEPAAWNALIAAVWEFDQVEGRSRARIFLNQSIRDARNEASWPEVYPWFGEKLTLLYDKAAPKLREEMDRYGA